jgi:hypothetical protein
LGILILMAVWEGLAPRRPLQTSKSMRWLSNLGIVFIDTITLRLLASFSAINAAIYAEKAGWGLLNNIALFSWVKVIIGVIVLDLAIYLQHAMFHGLPILWRLHIYSQTLTVTAPRKGKKTKVLFPEYRPDAAGDIVWTVTVDGDIPDTATATTKVISNTKP